MTVYLVDCESMNYEKIKVDKETSKVLYFTRNKNMIDLEDHEIEINVVSNYERNCVKNEILNEITKHDGQVINIVSHDDWYDNSIWRYIRKGFDVMRLIPNSDIITEFQFTVFVAKYYSNVYLGLNKKVLHNIYNAYVSFKKDTVDSSFNRNVQEYVCKQVFLISKVELQKIDRIRGINLEPNGSSLDEWLRILSVLKDKKNYLFSKYMNFINVNNYNFIRTVTNAFRIKNVDTDFIIKYLMAYGFMDIED